MQRHVLTSVFIFHKAVGLIAIKSYRCIRVGEGMEFAFGFKPGKSKSSHRLSMR